MLSLLEQTYKITLTHSQIIPKCSNAFFVLNKLSNLKCPEFSHTQKRLQAGKETGKDKDSNGLAVSRINQKLVRYTDSVLQP